MRLRLAFCRAVGLAAAFLALVLAGEAEAKRVALVIGNNAYRSVSALINPAERRQ